MNKSKKKGVSLPHTLVALCSSREDEGEPQHMRVCSL